MESDLFIRKSSLEDLPFIKILSDKNINSLGFTMTGKIRESIEKQHCFSAFYKDEFCGFVIFRHRKKDDQTTLSIICVEEKYRGLKIGTNLIEFLIDDCFENKKKFIQLKCPVDLPSNKFYKEMGFEIYSVEKRENKRDLNIFRYYI